MYKYDLCMNEERMVEWTDSCINKTYILKCIVFFFRLTSEHKLYTTSKTSLCKRRRPSEDCSSNITEPDVLEETLVRDITLEEV